MLINCFYRGLMLLLVVLLHLLVVYFTFYIHRALLHQHARDKLVQTVHSIRKNTMEQWSVVLATLKRAFVALCTIHSLHTPPPFPGNNTTSKNEYNPVGIFCVLCHTYLWVWNMDYTIVFTNMTLFRMCHQFFHLFLSLFSSLSVIFGVVIAVLPHCCFAILMHM